MFILLWFIVFLWIGLGYYALPLLWVPVIGSIWTRTMDVYRIWLYLAIPLSLLAALGFLRCAAKLLYWKRVTVVFLIALVVAPVGAGVVLKMNYAFSHTVNAVLP